MTEIVHAMEKRCGLCKRVKILDDFAPKRAEGGDIKGYLGHCKACDKEKWLASRDGREPKYDVAPYQDTHIRLFTEAIQEEAIAQIRRDRSIEVCADHLGIGRSTLEYWLSSEKEPYVSWARRFRLARAEKHRKPYVEAMEQEASAGNMRAIEFLLKTGFPDEFSDRKDIDVTVKRGQDEIDYSQYSVEELEQLRSLVAKGKSR